MKKPIVLLSFSGLLLVVVWFAPAFLSINTSTFHFTVTSDTEDSLSFTTEMYYIDKAGQKITTKDELTTPYQMIVETNELYGVFRKVSGKGKMVIKVEKQDHGGKLTSWFDESVIEIIGSSMSTKTAE